MTMATAAHSGRVVLPKENVVQFSVLAFLKAIDIKRGDGADFFWI